MENGIVNLISNHTQQLLTKSTKTYLEHDSLWPFVNNITEDQIETTLYDILYCDNKETQLVYNIAEPDDIQEIQQPIDDQQYDEIEQKINNLETRTAKKTSTYNNPLPKQTKVLFDMIMFVNVDQNNKILTKITDKFDQH